MKRLAVLLGLATLAAACERNPADLTTPSVSTTATDNKIVIIGFRATPGAAATALIQGSGGVVRQRYSYIPAVSASVPASQVDVLRANPDVAYVDEDFSMVPLGTRQVVDWGVSKIDAPGAWALGSPSRRATLPRRRSTRRTRAASCWSAHRATVARPGSATPPRMRA